jgi:hypothetical protein
MYKDYKYKDIGCHEQRRGNVITAIALPEIKPENMIGFFNNEYKLRRLSNSNDVCAIYDQIAQVFKLDYSTEVVNVEVAKLLSKFTQYLNERKTEKRGAPQKEISLQLDGITDDENIFRFFVVSFLHFRTNEIGHS